MMKDTEEIVEYLRTNKKVLRDNFGVTRLGIFGSFVTHRQRISSDIDLVVEFEKGRKNIHAFLRLKRFLEKELARKVDLGFGHSLKPIYEKTSRGEFCMSERDPRLYCEDILESGSAILDFVKGLSFDDFCDDRKTYSAVIREFEIIGEEVGKLPESFRERRPDVEWQRI
ncbi:MAG: nucleotidyltransferase domain-containing protein [Pseudomonadota bacterium]